MAELTQVTVKPAPWELECTQDRPCAKASEAACRACGFFGPVDRRRRQLLHCTGLRPRPDGTVGFVIKHAKSQRGGSHETDQ